MTIVHPARGPYRLHDNIIINKCRKFSCTVCKQIFHYTLFFIHKKYYVIRGIFWGCLRNTISAPVPSLWSTLVLGILPHSRANPSTVRNMALQLSHVLLKTLSDKDATPAETLNALKQAETLRSTHSLDLATFSLICKQLIDVVFPRLHHIARRDSASNSLGIEAVSVIQSFFLNGVPSIAFSHLSTALSTEIKSSPLSVETVAEILILFISEKNGGVRRLSRVISNVEATTADTVVTNLLHLPSKISNVLLSSSTSAHSELENSVINETTFFFTLCKAIYHVVLSRTSDMQRDQIISNLIARLVVLKHSDTLISSLLPSQNPVDAARLQQNTVASYLERAPPSTMHEITRALVNADAQTSRDETFITGVLSCLLGTSAARNSIIHEVALRRPLFRCVKRATKRIVRSVFKYDDDELFEEGLTSVAEMWSSEEFSLGADVMLQRQVTRLLLYYLRYSARLNVRRINHDESVGAALSSIMMVIVNGVHLRLDESDLRLRRHAMAVGEAASRHARDSKPLSFDRAELDDARREQNRNIGDDGVEDGGDSDFSDIAQGVGNGEVSSDENEETSVDTENESNFENNKNCVNGSSCTEKERKTLDTEHFTKDSHVSTMYTWPESIGGDWQEDDDWDSPASYETSADEVEDDEIIKRGWMRQRDEVALRSKLSAPMSVSRVLELLREMNTSDGGAITVNSDVALATLRLLTTRAEKEEAQEGRGKGVGLDALRSAAASACLEICRLEVERYPNEVIDVLNEARGRAFIAILRLDVTECGLSLVHDVICGEAADLSKRLEALTVLGQAIRAEGEKRIKTVESQRRPTTWITETGQFVEGIVDVFRALVEGVCDGAGAEFIQVEGRDCRLWAQCLVTLAAIANASGVGQHGKWMRAQVMDVSMNRVAHIDGEPVVRRAIALALGGVVDGMGDAELREVFADEGTEIIILVRESEDVDMAGKCIDWLKTASEEDADVGVRRFATMTLRKWAQRIETIKF